MSVSVKVTSFSTTTYEVLKYELIFTYYMPPICTDLAATKSNFLLDSLYRNAPHCAGISFMLFGIGMYFVSAFVSLSAFPMVCPVFVLMISI
ncbi:hypothetical protein D3C78_1373890 [compost metagenome]